MARKEKNNLIFMLINSGRGCDGDGTKESDSKIFLNNEYMLLVTTIAIFTAINTLEVFLRHFYGNQEHVLGKIVLYRAFSVLKV